jgi:tetratricopeptide (TPR) repeat protein
MWTFSKRIWKRAPAERLRLFGRSSDSRLIFIYAGLILVSCDRSSSHYVNVGNGYFAASRFADASLAYRKAIQKDPRNGEAYYRMGVLEQKAGNLTESLNSLSAAANLRPDREDIRTELARTEMAVYLADPAHPARLYDDLTKTAAQLAATPSQTYEGLRIQALLSWTDSKLKAAIELFQTADQRKPGQADLVASWCLALFQDGQFEQGERRALDLIKTQPHFGPIYDALSQAYDSRQRSADALNIIRMKVANNPDQMGYVIQLASWYSGSGDKQKMKAELDRLIANPAAFPDAPLAVGDFYANLQDWPEAVRLYRKGASDYPKRRAVYLKRLCDAWLAQGNLEEASRVTAEILKENPKDDAARLVSDSMAVSSSQAEKRSAALKDLHSLIEANPDKAAWRFTYASALLRAGDPDAAAREFRETLKERPDLTPARLALARIDELKGDYRESLQFSDEVLAARPDLLEAHFLRISGLIGTQRYKVARLELADLERQIPANAEVQFQIASLDEAEGKVHDAEIRLRKLSENEQNRSRAVRGLASVYLASNRPDQAWTALSAELSRNPDSELIQSAAAEVALRTDRYDDAVRLYGGLVKSNPQSAEYRKLLGGALQAKGNIGQAIGSYEKAVELAPGNPGMVAALADALRIAERREKAIAQYRRLLKIAPDNVYAMNNLAFLLGETGGDLEEALGLASQALRGIPGDDSFKDTLGFIYVKKNQGREGAQILQSLSRKYPSNPEIRFHFALALAEMGQKAQARTELEAALSNGPDPSMRKEILISLGRNQ